MKKISIYLSLCLTFLIFSCQEKKESIVIEPSIVKDHDEIPKHEKITENKKISDSLLNLAISKGDEIVYNSVAQDFITNENYKQLLYY